MEKIGSTNLSRQQIHFPRYDATRYRELCNQKVPMKYSSDSKYRIVPLLTL